MGERLSADNLFYHKKYKRQLSYRKRVTSAGLHASSLVIGYMLPTATEGMLFSVLADGQLGINHK